MSMRWPGVGLAGLVDEPLVPEAGDEPLTLETPEVGVTIGATGASALEGGRKGLDRVMCIYIYRANMARIRQSRSESGFGVQTSPCRPRRAPCP